MTGVTLTENGKLKTYDTFFYSQLTRQWFVHNNRGSFKPMNEGLLAKHLELIGYEGGRGDGPNQVHEVLIQKTLDPVTYAGPVAGRKIGLFCCGGQTILVTEPCRPLAAKTGNCGRILKWIFELCGHCETQYQTVLSWLHFRRQAVLKGRWRHSQLIVFAGPVSCGKSFIQNQIITPLLGGRVTRPYLFMSGRTNFNADLFSCEHLMIEDDVAARDLASRRELGNAIKTMLFNSIQHCHPKGATGFVLTPIWAISLSVNDEPENLMVIPPIDDSLSDKIILILCERPSVPVIQAGESEETVMLSMVQKELPIFAAFLDQWQVPDELHEQRCGVLAYKHPTLTGQLSDLAPESTLHRIIHEVIFLNRKDQEWRGTALELQSLLSSSSLSFESRKLLSFNTAAGTYLSRLARSKAELYRKVTVRGANEWIICRQND